MKKYFAKSPFTKDKVARRELALAHSMIALLSFALLTLIAAGANTAISFDAILASIAAVALVIVLLISTMIVVTLMRKI